MRTEITSPKPPMSQVEIRPVSSKKDQKQFMQLLWDHYRDDPNWIPPLRRNQQELLGFRHHPFHDYATVQNFLAIREGQPCGRISAILNPAHIERYDERVGFIGFFECIDDVDVARALFDAATAWLAEHEIHTVRGPINPSLNYEVGLQIEGFDTPPTFMMTYNPEYYGKLFEACGFSKVQDLYAFWGHIDMLDSLDKKLEFVREEATRRFNVKLRRMERARFDEEVRTFLHVYNSSLGGTWGFVPMSEGEVEHMSKSLRHLIVPEMTTVAEIDGKPVGAVFGLLDYNPRIREIDGRLFPFGFMKLLWNRKAIKKIRLISTNVLPEYQRWGLGLVVLARLVPEAKAWGIQEAEFSWVLESNDLSFKSLKRGGAELIKTYRIYDRPVTDTV